MNSGNSVTLHLDRYKNSKFDEKSEVMFVVERGIPERDNPDRCLRGGKIFKSTGMTLTE